MDQKEHANKENTLYDEVQKETTKARPPVVLSLSLFFFCRRVCCWRDEREIEIKFFWQWIYLSSLVAFFPFVKP
jgi:hypothetical protein